MAIGRYSINPFGPDIGPTLGRIEQMPSSFVDPAPRRRQAKGKPNQNFGPANRVPLEAERAKFGLDTLKAQPRSVPPRSSASLRRR